MNDNIKQGKYGIGFSGNFQASSYYTYYKDYKNWTAAPVPAAPGKKSVAFIGGRGISIMGYVPATKQRLAAKFISSLYNVDVVKAMNVVGAANNAIFLSPVVAFADTIESYPADVLATIKAQLKDAQGPPNCLGWEDSQNDVTSAVQKYLFGSTSAGDALDAAMVTATARVPEAQRKLLTYHDAYAYFAVHYGYTVIGAIQPSSFDEPTPKEIANLITQVRESGVKAVFGSEVFPSPIMEQIGAETGVRYVDVLRDDDLIGEPGDAEHSWLGLMRFNYVTMVEALGGDASALKTLDVSDVSKDSAVYPQ